METEELEFVLSPPLQLDSKTSIVDDKQPQQGTLSRAFEFLKSATIGADITRLQVPVQLNMPKSQLQMYGESVYCYSHDLLRDCARGSTPLQRFLNVVAWHISTTRLAPFGQAPFNPILGETHHVSSGSLNVFLEQVSHHPPVTALYATNEEENIRVQWWQQACPRFYGNSVEVNIHGIRELWLDSHKEKYEMTSPKLLIRLFPLPGNEWIGNTIVKCNASGLEAIITYKPKPFFGLRGSLGQISGEVFHTTNNVALCTIDGYWNRQVTMKDLKSGETSILFDAQKCISSLRGPSIKCQKGIKGTESIMVWREAMLGLIRKDWENARKAKHEVEERQRKLARKRVKEGSSWEPKYFVLDGGNWQWHNIEQHVPEAPISIPMIP